MLTYLYEWDSGVALHRRMYTFSEKECNELLTQPYVMGMHIKTYCLLTASEQNVGISMLKNIILKGIRL